MLKIRLSRRGSKKKAFYRIVVTDGRRKLTGKTTDLLGFWNPSKKQINLNKKRMNEWLAKGAVKSTGLEKILKI